MDTQRKPRLSALAQRFPHAPLSGMRGAVMVAACLILSGCGRSSDLFGRSYAVPQALKDPPVAPKAYCYRTLGATECYSRPFHRGDNRRVGQDLEEAPTVTVQPLQEAPPL